MRPLVESLEGRQLLAAGLPYTPPIGGAEVGSPQAVLTLPNSGVDNAAGFTIATSPKIPNVDVSTAQVHLIDTDGDADAMPSDYAVTIDWGDGTTTAGSLVLRQGPFTNDALVPPQAAFDVIGTHTYSSMGEFAVQTTLSGPSGGVATIPGHAIVSIEAIGGAEVPIAATAGADIAGLPASNASDTLIATFSDASAGLTPGAYVATIDWGDGTAPSVGRITYDLRNLGDYLQHWDGTKQVFNPGFAVYGDHTYANAGSFYLNVSVTSLAGVQGGILESKVVVSNPPPVAAPPVVPPVQAAPTVTAPTTVASTTDSAATVAAPSSPVHGFDKATWGEISTPAISTTRGHSVEPGALARKFGQKPHQHRTPAAPKGRHHHA